MILKRIIILLITICSVLPTKADWPVGKGRTSLILSYGFFYSSKYFDSTGKVAKFTPGDNFKSHTIGLTALHGITRRLDLSVSVPFIMQDLITNGKRETNSGIGDVTVGLALHFPSELYKRHLTVKAGFIVPAYENINTPYLGFASKGFQGAINYSFTPAPQSFAVIEGTYTRYIDYSDGPEQIAGSATFGKQLNKYSMVTFTFNHQISTSTNTGFNQNVLVNKNFNSGRVTMAYGRRLTRTITPFVQAFYTLYGTNMGIGFGGNLFFIVKLP
jgi:protein XagA